ncbi:peroxidase [Streptococcus pneumoniae]|nr:peroxidase [Streptococcus pneumoniae]
MNLENKRPRLFRDLPLFPKEQLREKYTGGDIVIHACADDEQIAFKVQTNLGATDKMNEYITHIGSGLFTCFGGVEKGGYIGQKLLEG